MNTLLAILKVTDARRDVILAGGDTGKILDTRVQHCLWGHGEGLNLCELENAQEMHTVPRLLSRIVG